MSYKFNYECNDIDIAKYNRASKMSCAKMVLYLVALGICIATIIVILVILFG